jgi:hypothetical protein
MSFVETGGKFKAGPAAAPGRIQREIGFMVTALKGILREAGNDGSNFQPARKPAPVKQLEDENDLLHALTRCCPKDQPMLLLMVEMKHAFAHNINACSAHRHILTEVLRENLRASDRIFELANGCLALALGQAKLLNGIMVAERIGIALEKRTVNSALVRVSIGIGAVNGQGGLLEALNEAKAAMARAAHGNLASDEVSSLNFIMS